MYFLGFTKIRFGSTGYKSPWVNKMYIQDL